MKPKPIVTTPHIVAALDGPSPRYICRDSKHGHWVVTTDHQKATPFESEADARKAAADYGRMAARNHFTRPGEWRAYAVTARFIFSELLPQPA